jgi:hypothetical protein
MGKRVRDIPAGPGAQRARYLERPDGQAPAGSRAAVWGVVSLWTSWAGADVFQLVYSDGVTALCMDPAQCEFDPPLGDKRADEPAAGAGNGAPASPDEPAPRPGLARVAEELEAAHEAVRSVLYQVWPYGPDPADITDEFPEWGVAVQRWAAARQALDRIAAAEMYELCPAELLEPGDIVFVMGARTRLWRQQPGQGLLRFTGIDLRDGHPVIPSWRKGSLVPRLCSDPGSVPERASAELDASRLRAELEQARAELSSVRAVVRGYRRRCRDTLEEIQGLDGPERS